LVRGKNSYKKVPERCTAAPENSMSATTTRTGFPDLDYIRAKVPIEEIAQLLGFEVHNHMMQCFRPEQHQHGDRTPSFTFYKDNRCQCHCCDPYAYSNLDFVMKVHGDAKPWPAIQWILEHFPDVPRTKAGRPRGSRDRHVRVGCYGGALESVVRSGLYGRLPWPTRSLLSVLVEVKDQHGQIEFAYESLMRLAGIHSSATLRKAAKELQDLHAIRIGSRQRYDGQGQRNIYTLTLDDPEFLAYIDATAQEHWRDIVQDRAAHEQYRKLRQHKPKVTEKTQL
jgi:hypothetical protein